MEKIGVKYSLGFGSLICTPFVLTLIFPALRVDDMDSESFIYSPWFVYTVLLLTSIFNGLG
jgi:hypothetical protein